ncbi:hypothetical protein FCH79_21880 [Pseudomonas koreensis]|nr:hypothetical protein [Pseudomonas koreensis]
MLRWIASVTRSSTTRRWRAIRECRRWTVWWGSAPTADPGFRGGWTGPIAGKPAPTVFGVAQLFVYTIKLCGSWLASDRADTAHTKLAASHQSP